jgi:hypothetical protein
MPSLNILSEGGRGLRIPYPLEKVCTKKNKNIGVVKKN